MECREGCAACCIFISISSPMPGLPNGKPAGMPCPHLTADYKCALFHAPERPSVCEKFKAEIEFCGRSREEAIQILTFLEKS